jgi:hypothetical protein
MITELYDALKEAGASNGAARKAAETMAAYENSFAKIDATSIISRGWPGFNLAVTTSLLALALKH